MVFADIKSETCCLFFNRKGREGRDVFFAGKVAKPQSFFAVLSSLFFLTAKVAKVYAKNAMFFLLAKSRSRKVFSHYCHPERSRRTAKSLDKD
ncbi:hypothetical protein B0A79_06695 [Flavobacterium piscis]|nr:hypothetical protein B0A79_06695 [Flavobacterium piscis]